MHWRRLLVLLVAVGVLGAIALRGGGERADDGAGRTLADPLFPGLEPARVTRTVIEFLDREQTVVIDRRGPRSWRVVEPYRSRATAEVLEGVLDTVARSAAERTAGFEAEAVGLDPPRVRWRFVETLGDGEQREWSLDVGDSDIDGLRLFARVDGRIVRVPRALESYINFGVHNWRDQRVLGVPTSDVIGFRRRGAIPGDDGSIDPAHLGELDLDVELDADGWRLVAPYRARLAPAGVEPLRLVLATFGGRGLLDQDAARPERYGLDPPAFEYTVELRDGSTVELDFGRFADGPNGSTWSVLRERDEQRAEGGVIWELLDADARLLTQPLDVLLEYDPLNAVPRSVVRVDVVADGAGLTLERPAGLWWALDPARPQESAVRAETAVAAAALQRLLGAELERFLVPEDLGPVEPVGAVVLTLEDETQVAGDLGPLHADELGEGRLFRRRGEDLWGVLSDDLAELAGRSPEDFRLRTVIEASEFEQRSVRVDGPDATRTWLRDADRGLWVRMGSTGEDRTFALAVEGLLNVEVESWFPRAEAGALEDVHLVTVTDRRGREVVFEVARAELAGERRVVLRQGDALGPVPAPLLEDLERLLAR